MRQAILQQTSLTAHPQMLRLLYTILSHT